MQDDKLPEMNLDDPLTWKEEGNEFFKRGQYEDAIKCYSHAIELDTNFIEGWNNLGLALLKIGKIDEAKKCNEKVKELNQKVKSQNDVKSRPSSLPALEKPTVNVPSVANVSSSDYESNNLLTGLLLVGIVSIFISFVQPIIGLFLVIVVILSSYFVYKDALLIGENKKSALSYAIGVLLLWIFVLPLYIYGRKGMFLQNTQNKPADNTITQKSLDSHKNINSIDDFELTKKQDDFKDESLFCRYCGTELKFSDAEICPHCGMRIKEVHKPIEKDKKPFWLGLIGVIFGFLFGLFAILFAGVASAFGAEGADNIIGQGIVAILFSILGFVGSTINNRKIGGILMIICGIIVLIAIGGFGVLPCILFVIGGIISLRFGKE